MLMTMRGIAGVAWVAGCVIASVAVMSYDFKPGRLGPRRTNWPEERAASDSPALVRHPGTITVLAFLHPRCVCTRATVTQLVRTLDAHPGAELIVPIFTPPAMNPSEQAAWEAGEYVKTLRTAFPQAQIVFDREGEHARQFGAYTSGTILVYDGQGKEMFRGGITNRRGGEQENPGLTQFASAVAGARPATTGDPSPVFGCPLVASHHDETRRGEL